MYDISKIKHVHLEVSSKCNARCPLCPRNLNGYPYNDGYTERDLTIGEVKQIFSVDFVKQLTGLLINGNFGDMIMNPDSADIVEYFMHINPNLETYISTNGGARNKEFWTRLGRLGVEVWFCIDGLKDTNHLYRQNVVWNTVIENAKTFIEAGGTATWKMIEFDFNQHQQHQAQKLAAELGFKKFQITREGRQHSPVFDKDGNLVHVIGHPTNTDFQKIFWSRRNDQVLVEDVVENKSVSSIDCFSVRKSSIYVSSTGDVYPCCYTGFQPNTYGHGNYMQAVNAQLKKIILENNALIYGLEHSIKWFGSVQKSWDDQDFNSTRLLICQDKCGTNWRNNTYREL